MTGWEDSRHPEWDLMYSAGLTAREIADLCAHNISTVHFHLRRREQYEPGFQSKHFEALKSRHPDRPTTQWRKQLNLLKEFINENGRLPISKATPEEARLQSWLVNQQRSYARGEMSPGKIFLLDSVFEWRATAHRDVLARHWLDRLQMVASYVSQVGQFPRYRNYTTELEHTLGVWLHIQHQNRSQKKLPEERLTKLNETIPGWRSHQ